jgi:crossover junction endodeoxyribonuclease RusA
MNDEALPWPPSMNHYWRHVTSGPLKNRTLISVEGKSYRRLIMAMALQYRWPRHEGVRLTVTMKCSAPDNRRRDLDNMPKALLDALVHAKVLEDDSLIDELHIIRLPSKAPGTVFLTITTR